MEQLQRTLESWADQSDGDAMKKDEQIEKLREERDRCSHDRHSHEPQPEP